MSKTGAGAMLRRAADIVDGDRDKTHGHKERSFTAIGALWTAYLQNRKDPDAPIEGSDVCAMMTLLKFARAHHGQYTEDHAVDAAGYAAIWGEVKALEVGDKPVEQAPPPKEFPRVYFCPLSGMAVTEKGVLWPKDKDGRLIG